mgnify:CR=1 FL=1
MWHYKRKKHRREKMNLIEEAKAQAQVEADKIIAAARAQAAQ